jgi:hypothetical protein
MYMNIFVNRITSGLIGLAILGVFLFSCEKSNGPVPYLCEHQFSQLVLLSKAELGSVPLGSAIPLDSLKRLIVSDAGMLAVVNMPEYLDVVIPIATVGKIVFTP